MKARNIIALGISGSALLAGQAHAQQAPAADKTAKPSYATATPHLINNVEDIVVTARRRAEKLQDVPVSIQAFNTEGLTKAGITRTENLQSVTPSLRIAPQSSGRATPVFELRGINSFDVLATQDPAVAVYVNEIYQARPVGLNQPLLDIESVQVLLGPQGTLFGRNSTAGAILFSSKRPTAQFEGEFATRIGNYDRLDISGFVNIPVTSTLAIRFAGQRVKRDGYTRDVITGKDYDDDNSWSGRASILWNPAPGIENYTVADYYDADESGTTNVLYAIRPTGAAASVFPDYRAQFAQQQARGPRKITADGTPFTRARAYGLANTTSIALSDTLTLKNIFGYRSVQATNYIDLDASLYPILQTSVFNKAKQYSNELQLQGQAFQNALTYIAGVYYFHENTRYGAAAVNRTTASTAGIPAITNTFGTNESYSVFAHATYAFPTLEGLSLTAGGRYSWDNRRAAYVNPTVGPTFTCVLTGLPAGSPCERRVEASFAKPSWTASIDYKIAPGKLVYFAHRRGYRSGGFGTRVTTPQSALPFSPEIVTDFEVGIKADWQLGTDALLRTNFAAYTNKYENIQRAVSRLIGTPPITTTSISNAASARIKGFEANVTFEPVRGFSINGFWGHVDAVHKKFNFVPNALSVGRPCGDQIIAASQLGTTVSCSNVPFGIAKDTIGGAVSLTPIDDEDRGQVTLTVNLFHSSEILGTLQLPLFEPEAVLPSYDVMNAVLSWNRIMGTGLSADIYMNNVFNDAYPVSLQSQQTSFGFTSATYNEPRMYGIRLKYAFGR